MQVVTACIARVEPSPRPRPRPRSPVPEALLRTTSPLGHSHHTITWPSCLTPDSHPSSIPSSFHLSHLEMVLNTSNTHLFGKLLAESQNTLTTLDLSIFFTSPVTLQTTVTTLSNTPLPNLRHLILTRGAGTEVLQLIPLVPTLQSLTLHFNQLSPTLIDTFFTTLASSSQPPFSPSAFKSGRPRWTFRTVTTSRTVTTVKTSGTFPPPPPPSPPTSAPKTCTSHSERKRSARCASFTFRGRSSRRSAGGACRSCTEDVATLGFSQLSGACGGFDDRGAHMFQREAEGRR